MTCRRVCATTTQESAKDVLMTSNDIVNHLRSNNVEFNYMSSNYKKGMLATFLLKFWRLNIKEEEIENVHKIENPKNADGTPKENNPNAGTIKRQGTA